MNQTLLMYVMLSPGIKPKTPEQGGDQYTTSMPPFAKTNLSNFKMLAYNVASALRDNSF